MGKIQVGDCVWGLQQRYHSKVYPSCREDERLPTEGKIFSKYYNISKLKGGVLSNYPLYLGEGMTLCVLSRVNLFFCALYLE